MSEHGRDAALACIVTIAITQELTDARIQYVDADTLVLRANGHELQLNLENLRRNVSAASDDEAAMQVIGHWVSAVLSAATASAPQPASPLRAEQMMLVVRSRDMTPDLDRAGVPWEPFVGDLIRVYAADETETIRLPPASDLASLHLDAAALRTRALANLAQRSPMVASLPPTTPGTFGQITTGDGYDADRIQLHDAWSRLGRGGHLVVAIPSRDLLAYSTQDDLRSLVALAAFAAERFAHAGHPLTSQLFRWSASGWEVVSQPRTQH